MNIEVKNLSDAIEDLVDAAQRIESSPLYPNIKNSYLKAIDGLIDYLNKDIDSIQRENQQDDIVHFVLVKKDKEKVKEYKLTNTEYYAMRENTKGIPKLALQVYAWCHDFRDRRGIRQSWDGQMSATAENKFYNTVYKLLKDKTVTEVEIALITEELLKISGMRQEWEQIDDDILDEIKQEWLKIFTT